MHLNINDFKFQNNNKNDMNVAMKINEDNFKSYFVQIPSTNENVRRRKYG